MKLSLIIPFFNEEQNLPQLVNDLAVFSVNCPYTHEVIFINDGSSDSSLEIIKQSPYKVISHLQNRGQGASWRTGIAAAQGEYLVFLDSDLQFKLGDILPMIELVEKGQQIIWGWRKKRQDPWSSVMASKVGNHLIRFLFSTQAHDCGCSLKVVRKDLLLNLPQLRNTHRYFPVLLKHEPFQTEYEVQHLPRLRGKSKYSLLKVFTVLKELQELKRLGY